MKMQCTVKPNDRQFSVELAHREAGLLSRLMNLLDPLALAAGAVAIEEDFNDHITDEMTADEVRSLFDAHNANMTESMNDYGCMILMIEQLKRLDKM